MGKVAFRPFLVIHKSPSLETSLYRNVFPYWFTRSLHGKDNVVFVALFCVYCKILYEIHHHNFSILCVQYEVRKHLLFICSMQWNIMYPFFDPPIISKLTHHLKSSKTKASPFRLSYLVLVKLDYFFIILTDTTFSVCVSIIQFVFHKVNWRPLLLNLRQREWSAASVTNH